MSDTVGEIPHVKLGDSGLSVSRVIAGCMSYGDKKWSQWVLEDEEKIMKILKKCYDVGIRTYDTADIYSNGKSEILLGKFLKKYNIKRDRVVILTKLFNPVDDTNYGFRLQTSGLPEYEYLNSKGLSRKHVFDAVKDSVRRLGTYIDVLQIHRLDRTTPMHEIMKALNDVILSGQVRYIGASSMKAVEFAQLQFIADKNGWFKFISMQNYYNLLYREEEREMNYFCQENILGKVGLIPWSPIAMGVLARPLNTESQNNRTAKTESGITHLRLGNLSGGDAEIVKRVEELAKKHGVSMAIISTAWVISKGTCPIVGLNSEERVEEIVKATLFKLTPEEIKYLEEPYDAKGFTIF
ncbi:NADP-dependent oxidoreductase domain-containing protein [Scheffersomyces amazonensis]|uniref:NADP-dependent oxidoreductase domain-containing protein n=1 Tax=Scheffersomyces amazonensis TaxID=1078765 RepID=UPI00315CBDA1